MEEINETEQSEQVAVTDETEVSKPVVKRKLANKRTATVEIDKETVVSAEQLEAVQQELNNYKERVEELAKEKRSIADERNRVLRERQQMELENHIRQLAKEHNMIDTAIEDSMPMLVSKFTAKDGRIVAKEKPDQDHKEYFADWIKARPHLQASNIPASTGVKPSFTGQLASNQPAINWRDSASITNYAQNSMFAFRNVRKF